MATPGGAWDFFSENAECSYGAHRQIIFDTFLPHLGDDNGNLVPMEERQRQLDATPGGWPFTVKMIENAFIEQDDWDEFVRKGTMAKRTMLAILCAAVGGCNVCSRSFEQRHLTYRGFKGIHNDHHDYLKRVGKKVRDRVEDPSVRTCMDRKWCNFEPQLLKTEFTHGVCNMCNT